MVNLIESPQAALVLTYFVGMFCGVIMGWRVARLIDNLKRGEP